MSDWTCKEEGVNYNHRSNLFSNSRVDSTDEITSVVSSADEIKNSKFSHYLCFCVAVKTNQFVYKQSEKYSPEQEKLHNNIKSLHDSGMSYRRITKLLNAMLLG